MALLGDDGAGLVMAGRAGQRTDRDTQLAEIFTLDRKGFERLEQPGARLDLDRARGGMIDEAGDLTVQKRHEMDEVREIHEVAHEGLAVAYDDRSAVSVRRRALVGEQRDEKIGNVRRRGGTGQSVHRVPSAFSDRRRPKSSPPPGYRDCG